MSTTPCLPHIALLAIGIIVSAAPSSAAAQISYERSGGYIEYVDEDDVALPLPPRPVPDYGRRVIETTVTTTRRIVSPSVPDLHHDEPESVVTTRRVFVPSPTRRPAAEVVVTTGPVRPKPLYSTYPVYNAEPVYAPVRAVRKDYVAPSRPAVLPQPVIIEERRVETTRRFLSPPLLD